MSSLKLDKVGGEKVTIILKGIITMKENLGILSWSLGEVLWDQDSAWKHTRSFEREEIEAGPSQTILSTQNQPLKDVFFVLPYFAAKMYRGHDSGGRAT